jgi:2-keto-4-pentenoate hydratase/2-oxohepta-3-ene-1,7-dioic acid hydratase in catechol pathway
MKLVTFCRPGGPAEPGVLVGKDIVPLSEFGVSCVMSIIKGGAVALSAVKKFVEASEVRVPLKAVRLLAPIQRPPKFICIGLNYRDHAIESGMAIPTIPTVFNKFPNVVIGPEDEVVLPKMSEQPDYEAEFAFVIAKHGKNIQKKKWKEYVFGYTNVNDVSARDIQLKGTTQWLMGKSFDTFAPTGPWLVTADEIKDPHNLNIRLRLNGKTMQNSSTKELIFDIPAILAHVSQVVTLEPGDIIATGTPPGVGMARKPPVFIKPGDVMEVEVEGLGVLRNPVVGS